MRIALLVDNSQAATDSIQFLREGLNGFAERLTTAGHSIALVTLGDRPTLQVDATADFTRLKSRGIDRLFAQPGSGMYLLEALIDTSKGFVKNETPRPVIVAVITEGKEFSNASADNVIKAIHDSGAQFYALLLTEGPRASDQDDEVRQRGIVLDRGTSENGGDPRSSSRISGSRIAWTPSPASCSARSPSPTPARIGWSRRRRSPLPRSATT